MYICVLLFSSDQLNSMVNLCC